MENTTTPRGHKEAAMPTTPTTRTIVTRTYETFEVHWSDGATWSNYDRDHAERIVAQPGLERTGKVVRKTFEHSWDLSTERGRILYGMAREGIAERREEVTA